MPTNAEIEAKVIEIVAEQMGVDKSEITRETSFVNDLNGIGSSTGLDPDRLPAKEA